MQARQETALTNAAIARPAFNYWEPLHLLTHPPSPHGSSQSPFQTWEYSPQFAIRSWAYVAQYVPVAGWLVHAMGRDKVRQPMLDGRVESVAC